MVEVRQTVLPILIGLLIPFHVESTNAVTVTIPVNATLYLKHQACLADVRGTAGKITSIHLTPAVDREEALDGLMCLVYWDGMDTPFIVCSLRELLELVGPDGTPVHLPDFGFGNGFRVFLECVSGAGATVRGRICYETAQAFSSTRRARFDPWLGITHPQLQETVHFHDVVSRPGRGEAVFIRNPGFESGVLGPWRDATFSFPNTFQVHRSGVEGVRAHSGEFMGGTVNSESCLGLGRVRGLIPGYRYRLSAWVNTFAYGEEPTPQYSKVRLGINTTGMLIDKLFPEEGDLWTVDFSHARFYFPHCWGARFFADSQDHWSRISVSTRARGEVASLFLRATHIFEQTRKWCLFDDVTLENIPIPMGTIAGRVTTDQGKRVKRPLVTTAPWGLAVRGENDGRFWLENIPEGVYTVEAVAEVGSTSLNSVRVRADRTTTIHLVLGENPIGEVVAEVTEEGENLLINAGFESGDCVGWDRAYRCDGMEVTPSTHRVVPPSGEFMFGGEHVYHFAGVREIIYQRIPVSEGSRWTLSGRLFAHTADQAREGTRVWLVADPAGKTDFPIASKTHTGEWETVAVSFEAAAEMVTVGVAMEQKSRDAAGLSDDRGIVEHLPDEDVRVDYEGYYCDDVRLVLAATEAVMAAPFAVPKRPAVAASAAAKFPDEATAVILLPDGHTRMALVRIPAGGFLMGGDSRTGWARDDEFPRRHVELNSYWIGKYEVTNAQYQAFCDACDYPYPPDPAFSKIPWVHRDRRYHYGDYFTGMPDYPVVNVTWHDAQAFCKWSGLRLPMEAEWEMAARGDGDSLRTYPWGEQTDPAWTTRTRGNLSIQKPDGDLYTCRVDKFETSKRPYNVGVSFFGVCGMGGNVREWCNDWYGSYATADQRDPAGPPSGREKVLRGGCWRGRDYGVMTRCSYRFHHDPKYYEWGTTGFRVAADVR